MLIKDFFLVNYMDKVLAVLFGLLKGKITLSLDLFNRHEEDKYQ